jgi:hypothetical protein
MTIRGLLFVFFLVSTCFSEFVLAQTEPGHDGELDHALGNETEHGHDDHDGHGNETDHGHDDHDHEHDDDAIDPVMRLLERVSGPDRTNMTLDEFRGLFDHILIERSSVAFGDPEDGGHDHDHSHGRRSTICLSVSEVFAQNDENQNGVLDSSELLETMAQLAAMRTENCFVRAAVNCNPRPTPAQVWGFGFLSVIIITLVSLIAVIFIPLGKARIAHHILTVLVAFGFGAIAGDALFHIMPALYTLHTHGESASEKLWERRFSCFYLVAQNVLKKARIRTLWCGECAW